MRIVFYFLVGVLFGITLFKSEAASWFRIYEMFRFESFHMYGIIGTAVTLGIIIVQLIKRFEINSFYGKKIEIKAKEKSIKRYLYGGFVFGLGWALAGACPGPIFVLLGAGFTPIIIVVLSAIVGTYCYGLLKDRLPH
ncbi:DUF6691 family protein [uncultured Tenacibaculum sp.]|uniref:DUF6691 family protein n=1 Tax=uncultured Tenacibaculum sp. TaxID=174713 RepID=UPI002619CFF6|nr:DUF6691 family protein [uncultured Tenacibaculum sp.]